ncbi:pantoate--beta-alanine ligase [Pseudochrobactrum sp. sp1633]|uniref:pantoate--beta-alanine ligase n=1 Tax=Pseudochrobactrum sp. sp1633 TaxID=3036706 RepID=UPI0025A5F896|nr:pantoate--beta-alanine ligase [Pseudochrobactrum sp. sp1633]MDM8346139.1 pantoate--beta-alanine ligase [Pseudochrobactrum sp. sp1633]HWD13796.1 pantoate--beta-alanine ligase [Pseudochrobactrum sp.]
MQLIRTIADLRTALRAERSAGKTVGFVPTMGYLHIGHLTLAKHSQLNCDVTVVSIFVNPTQFSPNEDLAQYPRNLPHDLKLLEEQGVDYVFAPEVDEMYPDGSGKTSTYVDVGDLSSILMGALRPNHFRGVATVVSKLFNIVQPDKAFFGEKDYQQLAVIKRMVTDLNQPVEVFGVPTVREPDGLACSSRNSLLSAEDRAAAIILPQAMQLAQTLVDQGERSVSVLHQAVLDKLQQEARGEVEAVDIRDAETLAETAELLTAPAVLLLTVRFGKTRLIDQHVLRF